MKSIYILTLSILSLALLVSCDKSPEAEENKTELKTEAEKWTEQTKKLGSAAWKTTVDAAQNVADDSEGLIEKTKQKSKDLYESSKDIVSETYSNAKEKSQEVYDTAKAKTEMMMNKDADSQSIPKEDSVIENTKQKSKELYDAGKETVSNAYDVAKEKTQEVYEVAKEKTSEFIKENNSSEAAPVETTPMIDKAIKEPVKI